MIEDMDLRQEKLDEMRQDMLIEQALRSNSDYFYDHLLTMFGARLDDLKDEIIRECALYEHDSDYWIEELIEN